MKKITLSVISCLFVLAVFLGWNITVQAATPLEACGYHDLTLDMEQLATSWEPWYTRNDQSMWLWNQYMDIYRVNPDDGEWGKNYENEFGGWPSDSDLYNEWGFHWDSYPAMTCTRWWCECCKIIESDIVFNPAYSWTANRDYAEDHPASVIYYDSALLHEMGHSWGMQMRNETYDYDDPTVMHAYNRYSVQDRMTIHVPEAYLIRRNYDDQTPIRTVTNMGVFSKYADSHWRNSWTNSSSYFGGDPITINNITVENTGTTTLSHVRIRLYLSTNRTISTGDTLIGAFGWGSFPAERYGVFDFTTTIPRSLEAGTYYVGAIVTYNEYSYDSFSWDNTTHLWDTISVAQRSITVTSPNGGETWYVGQNRNITWSSANAGSYVKIQISRNGGGIWSTITSSTYNDGSYTWTVTTPTSSTCRIRVTSTTYPSVTDTSDANFIIARADPVPDIKANGSDGPITLPWGTPVSITVSLDPGDFEGQNADWWIPERTLWGWYSYVYPTGWLPGFRRCLVMPLHDLPSYEVFDGFPSSVGTHTYYFGVDDNADGVCDATWYDSVVVHVQPKSSP